MPANARRKKTVNYRQVAFTRFMFIVAILVLWIGGVGARLVYLQVEMHEELREKAVGQRRDVKKTKQLRGTIYDRNERALAISVRVKTLFADATKIEDADQTAKKLAKTLGLDEKKLRKQLKEAVSLERKFVPIAKGLDDVEAAEINSKLETAGLKKADLPRYPGLHWRDDQKRSYPNGELAAHV